MKEEGEIVWFQTGKMVNFQRLLFVMEIRTIHEAKGRFIKAGLF